MNPSLPAVPPSGGRPLQHVKTLTGLSRRRLASEDVLELIEERQIKWAWNIGRKDAVRPELRFWRDSLLAYFVRESAGTDTALLLEEDLTLDQIVTAILPRVSASSSIRVTELEQRFLCCRNHIFGLLRDGELESANPLQTRVRALITYRSAFEFLHRRCLTV